MDDGSTSIWIDGQMILEMDITFRQYEKEQSLETQMFFHTYPDLKNATIYLFLQIVYKPILSTSRLILHIFTVKTTRCVYLLGQPVQLGW